MNRCAQLKPLVGIDDVHLGLLSCLPFDIVLMVVDYDRRKMKFLNTQLQIASKSIRMREFPGLLIDILLPPFDILQKDGPRQVFSDHNTTVVYRAVFCHVFPQKPCPPTSCLVSVTNVFGYRMHLMSIKVDKFE